MNSADQSNDGVTPWEASALQSAEMQALLALDKSGVEFLFDDDVKVTVSSLKEIAKNRQVALIELDAANKAFVEAFQSDGSINLVAANKAADHLGLAQQYFGQITYPDRQDFALLRGMLAAERLQVRACARAVEHLWWGEVVEYLKVFDITRTMPSTAQSINQASSALDDAARLIENQWPVLGPDAFSLKIRAGKMVESRRNELDQLRERALVFAFDEIEGWIGHAKGYLREEQSGLEELGGGYDADASSPQAAIECLVHARTQLEALKAQDAHGDKAFEKRSRYQTLAQDLDSTESAAARKLKQAVQGKQRAMLETLIVPLTASNEKGEKLLESQEFRESIDALRFFLNAAIDEELFTGLDANLRSLVLMRSDNLATARQYMREIRNIISDERRDKALYWLFLRLTDVMQLDPDNQDAEELLSCVKGDWEQQWSKFKQSLDGARASQERIMKGVSGVNTAQELQAMRRAVREAKAYVDAQQDHPGKQDLSNVEAELLSLEGQWRVVSGLCSSWKSTEPGDAHNLIEETRRVASADCPRAMITELGFALDAAVAERGGKFFANPLDALESVKLSDLLRSIGGAA